MKIFTMEEAEEMPVLFPLTLLLPGPRLAHRSDIESELSERKEDMRTES